MIKAAAPFPMGVTIERKRVQFTVEAGVGARVSLCLYDKSGNPVDTIPFPEGSSVGAVHSMWVEGVDTRKLLYCYEIDGCLQKDPYGRFFPLQKIWGDKTGAKALPLAAFVRESFDWEEDAPLRTPLSDLLLYHIHTRGFTMHPSSRVRKKGTFSGILERVGFLKELGVNAVELMPVYEYEEVAASKDCHNPYREKYGGKAPAGRLNYWGYGPASYFAPKAAFGTPAEFKQMVKILHQNGIEVILEFYFTPDLSTAQIQDIICFWVWEYHVDGIHMIGNAPLSAIAEEGMLKTTRLFATDWGEAKGSIPKHLCQYNDGFLVDMRKFLKGDEDRLKSAASQTLSNPSGRGVVNYMAGVNGFTLYDSLCYDQKHNEANGEDNRDGNCYNYSWNCGVEGPTRRKKVLELRKRQFKNAIALLYLSQGIPLILSGDEMGQSKRGNNNTYCQDNELSWLNWNNRKTNRDMFDFVRAMIAFRKAHPVFHMPEAPRLMDYKGCGWPDVSLHGEKPWYPEFDNFRRQLGILYHGSYAKRTDGSHDNNFYVVYNMHWEPHEFSLPTGDKKEKWHLAIDTTAKEGIGIYPAGEEPLLADQKKLMAEARSIAVLIGKG